MRARVAGVLRALLAAGCTAEPATDATPAEGPPLRFAAPVSTGLPPQPLVSTSSFEPFVAADSQGRIFVADAGARFSVSLDGGSTFLPRPGPLPAATTLCGDVALAVDARDRLWFAQSHKCGGAESRGIRVALSEDGGLSWTPPLLLEHGNADRPWWAIDGERAHLVWLEVDTMGVYAASSTDARSFTPPRALAAQASFGAPAVLEGRLLVADCGGISDGDGRRIRFPRELPSTFCMLRPMLAARPGDPTLHLAWLDVERRVCVAASVDASASWRLVECRSPGAMVLDAEKNPNLWLVASARGVSVAAFARSASGEGVDLHVTRFTDGVPSRGVAVSDLGGRASAPANTDFPALAALPDGRLVAAWAPREGDVQVATEQGSLKTPS